MLSASVDLEIPFFDVDSLRIAWHGHYVKYFEIARCRLLDDIDYNYKDMEASGYAFPIVDLHIKYVKPAVFLQTVCVTAILVDWENRLKIKYRIEDKKTGIKLTVGHTIQAAVNTSTQELSLVSPQILLDKITAKL